MHYPSPYSQTFAGIPIQQSWEDLGIWELFFDAYPVRTMIELGSGYGAMSLFFAIQCAQRGIHFETFDNQSIFDVNAGLHGIFGFKNIFHNVNIFGEAPHEAPYIRSLIASCARPLAIFFDNGNKPREWQMFAPLTLPGDFCIVHDWGEEFKQEDIGDVKVERILTELCDQRPPSWKAMWFQRV